ncbi:MAG TPA: WG repeat-containing protein, partial [Cyclobacteriaceae bacterium]
MKCVIGLFLFFLSSPAWALDYQVFEENGKKGIKNDSGEIILPASFEALGWSDGSFSVIGQVTGYRIKNQWGLLNLKKEFLTKAEYEQLSYTGGDRIIASKKTNPFTTKLGCINLEGKLTIPFSYDGIKINGLRAVVFIKNGSKYEYGLIDLSDKGILPLKYKGIESLGTLRYAVQNFDNKIALFTEQGTKLTDFTIDSLSSFHKGWAIIYQEFRQGLLSREGEIKAAPNYREVKINDDGTVNVRTFDSWKTIDASNKENDLIEADALFPDGDKYRVIKSGKTGLLDKDFKVKITPRYDYLGNFVLGKAVAKKENKYGVIRLDNSVIMPFLFDSLVVDGRLIRVKDKTAGTISWSLFDTVGVRKSEHYYDFIDQYNGRFFPVVVRGYVGGMNNFGKEIIHCVYDSIIDSKEDRAAVKFKGQYGIISLDENWLLTPQRYPLSLVNNELYLEKQPTVTFLKNLNGETIYFTSNKLGVKENALIETFADGSEQKVDFEGRIATSTVA